jgi:hypothetical protein
MSFDLPDGDSPPSHPCFCSSAGRAPDPTHGQIPHATVLPFLEKRTFDFSTLSGTAQISIVLCPAIHVHDYSVVKLAVRVHSLTMSVGQLLRFYIWGTLPSDEDPSQDFVDATEFQTVDITSSTTAPALVAARATYDPDAYLRISLRATQTSAPTTFRATLSAGLQLRNS